MNMKRNLSVILKSIFILEQLLTLQFAESKGELETYTSRLSLCRRGEDRRDVLGYIYDAIVAIIKLYDNNSEKKEVLLKTLNRCLRCFSYLCLELGDMSDLYVQIPFVLSLQQDVLSAKASLNPPRIMLLATFMLFLLISIECHWKMPKVRKLIIDTVEQFSEVFGEEVTKHLKNDNIAKRIENFRLLIEKIPNLEDEKTLKILEERKNHEIIIKEDLALCISESINQKITVGLKGEVDEAFLRNIHEILSNNLTQSQQIGQLPNINYTVASSIDEDDDILKDSHYNSRLMSARDNASDVLESASGIHHVPSISKDGIFSISRGGSASSFKNRGPGEKIKKFDDVIFNNPDEL